VLVALRSAKNGLVKRLFFGFERLVLRENGRDGFCGYGPPYKRGKLPAVVDMGKLETDNESKAETGDADQRITDDIDHSCTPQVSLASSSTIGIAESASEHSLAITMKRFV
jgi:hypothetical protein